MTGKQSQIGLHNYCQSGLPSLVVRSAIYHLLSALDSSLH